MNPARRPLIAGNWKMHHGGPDGIELTHQVAQLSRRLVDTDLVVAPPFTALAACAHEADGSKLAIAAQNVHAAAKGAFTGEVSASMVKECGATWVILGHSERRQLFGETDAVVAEKLRTTLEHRLAPIVCVGETLAEREDGSTLAVVERQLLPILPLLAASNLPLAIAYEPVWAIGTGKNAGPAEAEEVHAAIRRWLEPQGLADRVRILYGGSVKADNAESLLRCPNVDGALVGGASLEIGSFAPIAEMADHLTKTSESPS